MRKYYNNDKLKFYIGDVRDYNLISRAFIGFDYVFHAAVLRTKIEYENVEFDILENYEDNYKNIMNEFVNRKIINYYGYKSDVGEKAITKMTVCINLRISFLKILNLNFIWGKKYGILKSIINYVN